jgi:hypothetical protein
VASCALIAVAWPSLGVLPLIALESVPHQHIVAPNEIDPDGGAHSPKNHRHADASDIPGSPTHPADHDCFQCQVLKHLSRCVLSQPPAPDIALPAGCTVQPEARAQSQHEGHVAFLPPVRAPPPLFA